MKNKVLSADIQKLAKTIGLNQAFCEHQGDCNKCILYKKEKCDFVTSAIQCINAGYKLVDPDRTIDLPAKIGDPYYSIEWFCTQGGEYNEPTQVSVSACENCCEECDGKQRIVTNYFQSIQNILNVQRGIRSYYYLTEEDAKIALLHSKKKEMTTKTKIIGIGDCIKIYNRDGVKVNEFWLLGQALHITFEDGTIIRVFREVDEIKTIVIENSGSAYQELTTCDWSMDALRVMHVEEIESDIFEIDSEVSTITFEKN